MWEVSEAESLLGPAAHTATPQVMFHPPTAHLSMGKVLCNLSEVIYEAVLAQLHIPTTLITCDRGGRRRRRGRNHTQKKRPEEKRRIPLFRLWGAHSTWWSKQFKREKQHKTWQIIRCRNDSKWIDMESVTSELRSIGAAQALASHLYLSTCLTEPRCVWPQVDTSRCTRRSSGRI